MTVTLLDPTNEEVPVARQITPRPETVKGRVAFMDISKRQGNLLLDRLQEAFEQAGRAIAKAGYQGPFGVDSYLHKAAGGRLALNALSEINGRYTMDWAQTRITDPSRSPA